MQNQYRTMQELVDQSYMQVVPLPPPEPSIAQAIKEASSLIAEALHANAEATVLLARATAGEFEEDGQVEAEGERYLDGSPRA